MEDAGIITGYRAEVNTAKIGYPITAIMRLHSQGERCIRLNTLVREIPEVLECYRVTGEDCHVMKIMVSSVEHLESLIDRLSVHGQVTTSIVLSTPVTRRIVTRVAETANEERTEAVLS
jgi:Lrp/AsnC family transcriptional regulator, leucine-responsive regulatory protein